MFGKKEEDGEAFGDVGLEPCGERWGALADRVGIEPSYLSKIERGEQPPPGEQNIRRLAEELGENPDALLALAGKVSSDLLQIIRERPTVVAELLRAVRAMPAKKVSAISRQIRDGDW